MKSPSPAALAERNPYGRRGPRTKVQERREWAALDAIDRALRVLAEMDTHGRSLDAAMGTDSIRNGVSRIRHEIINKRRGRYYGE